MNFDLLKNSQPYICFELGFILILADECIGLNLISSNQETDMYSNNLTGKSFRNSINFQNGPTKLIPNEQRYHGQRYSQDMSSYDNSGLIYSAHPGGAQLSNHNENFNPYSKGVWTKQAPYL